MKEQPKTCRTCKHYVELPFTEHQMFCMNDESEYADCECEDNDTCEDWTPVNEED